MLSVLYQYENLTEDLEEDAKTGDKKRKSGGENKVVNKTHESEASFDWQ